LAFNSSSTEKLARIFLSDFIFKMKNVGKNQPFRLMFFLIFCLSSLNSEIIFGRFADWIFLSSVKNNEKFYEI